MQKTGACKKYWPEKKTAKQQLMEQKEINDAADVRMAKKLGEEKKMKDEVAIMVRRERIKDYQKRYAKCQ